MLCLVLMISGSGIPATTEDAMKAKAKHHAIQNLRGLDKKEVMKVSTHQTLADVLHCCILVGEQPNIAGSS